MSCGKHHDVDCEQILERVYVFIDHELDEKTLTYASFEQHLTECGPCLDQVDVERVVKTVVARSCSEHASAELRARVLTRIHELRIEISEG